MKFRLGLVLRMPNILISIGYMVLYYEFTIEFFRLNNLSILFSQLFLCENLIFHVSFRWARLCRGESYQ